MAQDASGTLASSYLPGPPTPPAARRALLLIAPDGTVSVARTLPDGFRLTAALRQLAAQVSTSPAASDS